MPKQAFMMAGSYEQAFFRIMRAGDSVSTLEFDMTVLADKVISGLVPADYITPVEDIFDQIEAKLKQAGIDCQDLLDEWKKKFNDEFNLITTQMNTFQTNSQTLLAEWTQKFTDAVNAWDSNYTDLIAAKNTLTEQFKTLQQQIADKNLVTTDMLELTALANITLGINTDQLGPTDLPRFIAYGYYGGAGIPQTTLYYGVPETILLDFSYSITNGGDTLVPRFSLTQLSKLFPDYDVANVTSNKSSNGHWMYLRSGKATIGIQCLNTIFN